MCKEVHRLVIAFMVVLNIGVHMKKKQCQNLRLNLLKQTDTETPLSIQSRDKQSKQTIQINLTSSQSQCQQCDGKYFNNRKKHAFLWN